MPDHVHLLVEVDPQFGIHRLVKDLKGVSSHNMAARVSHPLTLKHENGRWYACFSCLVDVEPLPANDSVVGIDVGLASFAVTSDGKIVDNPRWFRRAQKKLRVVQRHASRCTQRSGGWRKACRFVAQLHRHVCNQRNDFQHKRSRELVNHHGFIAVEDLDGKGLAGGMLAQVSMGCRVVKLHRKAVL
jgi:transposase